jgi:hypothetical protein
VVDLPTATDPETPMMNGTWGMPSPRKVRLSLLSCADRLEPQVDHAGQREVDLADLLEVDVLADTAEFLELLLAEHLRHGTPQRLPLGAVEGDEGVHIGEGLGHVRILPSHRGEDQTGDAVGPGGPGQDRMCGDP